MEEEYNKIRVKSKDDWLTVLENEEKYGDDILDIIKFVYLAPNHQINCKIIASYMNTEVVGINSKISSFGKRVLDLLDLPEVAGSNGQHVRWNIPFMTNVSLNKNGRFIWKLRPELIDAIEEKYEYGKRYKIINQFSIGDTFTRDQLMAIFKISGQSGMMKTNVLNALVLTTSEYNGIYEDSGIESGTIQYTGEGQIGDQTITKNNKTLYYSGENNIPVYLFSKDKNRKYIFEGRVELYDKPYKSIEKDINGNDRFVYKFPLRIIYNEIDNSNEELNKISYEIVEIASDIKISDKLIVDDSPLEIRKYRKNGTDRKVNRTKKPDYIAEELVKTRQGELNEKVIYERELQKMMELDAQEEVDRMKAFFENRNDSEGYDILSFEQQPGGTYREIYIEVKSTIGNEGTPIDISDNELEFAKNHIDQYYIYRIYSSKDGNRILKIINGKDLLEKYNFIPSFYKIYSK